jgi:hypothetical protein
VPLLQQVFLHLGLLLLLSCFSTAPTHTPHTLAS